MTEKHLLTRVQIDYIVRFAIREGEFAQIMEIDVDQETLDTMITTILAGYESEEAARTDWADIYDWIQAGINNEWCSEPVCATHDGIPIDDDEEEELFEAGYDPCQVIIRLW